MPLLPTRYDLLRARLERFSLAIAGVERRDVQSVHRTRVSTRRLRELVPVLQLDGDDVTKLSHQLRKVTRRLGRVREADVMLLSIAELHESGRFAEPALRLVRDAARARRDEARADMPAKETAAAFRRIVRKLDRAARKLDGPEDAQARRAWLWALDARVSQRALALSRAIDKAGSVYLAERLHATRIALKKLRYGLELDVEARGLKSTKDLRALRRIQEVLGRLHDHQLLIDHVRGVQASLTPPSVSAWRDLDTVLMSLEESCRRLHARYVRERPTLIDICDGLARRSVTGKAAPTRRSVPAKTTHRRRRAG
jgi:CHAD domain-containing protein